MTKFESMAANQQTTLKSLFFNKETQQVIGFFKPNYEYSSFECMQIFFDIKTLNDLKFQILKNKKQVTDELILMNSHELTIEVTYDIVMRVYYELNPKPKEQTLKTFDSTMPLAARLSSSMKDYSDTLIKATSYSGSKEPRQKIFSASMLGKESLVNFLSWKEGTQENNKVSANTLGSLYQLGVDQAFNENNETIEIDNNGRSVKSPRFISALRLTADLSNGWTVSGEMDQLDFLHRIIIDNKVVSGTAYKEILKNKEDHDYSLQLGVYKWLLWKNGYGDNWEGFLSIHNKAGAAIRDDQFANFAPNTFSLEDIELLLLDATNTLDIYIEGMDTGLNPPQCDIFKYGKTKDVPNRCALYCSYNSFCPYWTEYRATNAMIAKFSEVRDAPSKSVETQIFDSI